jgi:hypothetical protein
MHAQIELDAYFERIGYSGSREPNTADAARDSRAAPASDSVQSQQPARAD